MHDTPIPIWQLLEDKRREEGAVFAKRVELMETMTFSPNVPAIARWMDRLLEERFNPPHPPNPPGPRLRAAVALRIPPPVPAIASSIVEGGERYTRRKVAVGGRSA
jgi:hypothetical protein